MKSGKVAYMDHAATTPVDRRAIEAMMPYLAERFANPATIYSAGRKSEEAVETARKTIADAINASPGEIFFTSGGTESDNWAIKGVAAANEKKGRHIITSAIEHHAILEPCEYLGKHGWDITVLPVSRTGLVDPGQVDRAIRPDTVLVSIMHANNEIGTIEPIARISEITRSKGVIFHTDAVQTVGKIPVDAAALGIDLLSAAAHKFYGPKGIGFLYVRRATAIDPLHHGGGHERGRRAGTLNAPEIVAMGKALQIAGENIEAGKRLGDLRKMLWEGLSGAIPDIRLNTDFANSLPWFLNVVIEGVEGEAMLLRLDAEGIQVSSGSACTTGSLEPSHVLLAIGLPPEVAHGSLRFTLGRENTEEDIRHVLDVLPGIVSRLRAMSPTYRHEGSV